MDSQPDANAPPATRRKFFSISIREALLILAIAGLLFSIVFRSGTLGLNRPKALFTVDQPVRIKYWHQRGDRGSGTSDWRNVDGLSFFENYVVVHDDSRGEIILLDDLTDFRWIPDTTRTTNRTIATPGSNH